MKKQAIVIGLGNFGMSLARSLSERGVEVLAIDDREDHVHIAAGFVAEALCFDATEEEALAKTLPGKRDVCICAMGNESREASIICTALLRQLGALRVIARANDMVHARILTLVGAHRIINPEKEFGERFANQIIYDNIKAEMTLGEGILITEAKAPSSFIGKDLNHLQLPNRFNLTVVAVRRAKSGEVILPSPKLVIEEDDFLVVVSKEGAVLEMMARS